MTLDGDLTIEEVLSYFQDHFDYEVTMLSTPDDIVLYNDMFDDDDRLEQKLTAVYLEVTEEADMPSGRFLYFCVVGEFADESGSDESGDDDEDDDEDAATPRCRLRWR